MAGGHKTTEFDRARDRLFSEMHRCGVCGAEEDQVEEWLSDTIGVLGQHYPELTPLQLAVLHKVGRNFAAPTVAHGAGNDARNR